MPPSPIMPTTKTAGLTGDQWREKLVAIASHLKQPVSLCLMGSGPSMMGGQINRASIDLDSWQEASKFGYTDLKQACEKAGLAFNPKDEIEPDVPYIQIVEKGVAQLGKFSETTEILLEGQLVVTRPPFANIVASKLVRSDPKDIEDMAYIVSHYGVTKDEVVKVLKSFPATQREVATENLVYFDVIAPPKRPELPIPKSGISRERAQ